jgi:membrane associated rhomboid family serine protease
MLDDRPYMRASQRQYWSMTTVLLVSLAACYLVQYLMELQLGEPRISALFALSLDGLRAGKYYQLITFQFMHAGIWHLLCNMIGLYFFGRMVEEMLGAATMLKLYLLSGTVGGLCHVALCVAFPNYFYAGVVGASAGIFGLIAAFATREPNYPITLLVFFVLPVTMLAKWLLLIEAAISVVGLFLQGTTAHAAHLGGMLTGIAFVKWSGWFSGAGGLWGMAQRRRAPRPMVRATVLRAVHRPRKTPEELPPAEFISREVDPILEKISAHGIHSLTDRERQILESARNKMARR